MPDSVKISDLTPRSAATDDVLPAVDGTFNSTVRVTAASIAAIGGGPPGDGTVTTTKIVNNNVTLPKIQQITARRLLGNSTASTANVGEIPVSADALAMLALGYSDMRTAIGFGSVFSGQASFADGTQDAPSIANTGNLNTGIYWPAQNTIGIATEGKLRFYVDGDGTQYSAIADQFDGLNPVMRAQYACRAWVAFNGSSATTTTINSQSLIAQRYGRTGSLYNDGWTSAGSANNGQTVKRIEFLENGNGNTISLVASAAADTRTNYTTPADNTHWFWNPAINSPTGGWDTTPASGKNWIGKIQFAPTGGSAAYGILSQGGVTSVTNTSTGVYRITFKEALPDTDCAVVISSKRASFATSGGDELHTLQIGATDVAAGSRTATGQCTSITIRHYEQTNLTNSAYISVAVFR